MTQLSRDAILGVAKETTLNTYLAPTAYLPFTKADFVDTYAQIKDESYRANDTVLQGSYQGVVDATWDIDLYAYPDLTGHFLRSIIGPDTVTPGVSTTLSASTSVGATSITVAASIPAASTIMIDTGTKTEYATTGTPTGSGPYTIPLVTPAAGLGQAHNSGVAVVSASTHLFKQSSVPTTKATYSFTVWDTTQWLSYSGAAASELQIKIDPKSAVTLGTKWTSLPGVSATTQTPAYTQTEPNLGWQWNNTNAGGASTRGLSLDLTVKRAVESIHSSDGIQAPREIFQAALETDGTYKTIFENQTDLALYTSNTQLPIVAALTQPLAKGGSTLTFTMSKSAWHSGKRMISGNYVTADFTISGVYNATDGGAVQASLTNYVTTAY